MNASHIPVARLDGVLKRYGKLTAVDGLDLSVHRGELLALLGPNGDGKSTSVALLLGLVQADSGRVELFGRSPQQIDARRRIGVMLQEARLPPSLRVGDLLKRPYGKLSGGQQRRVQFALALCGRPELLFLDEPTVGMDIEARQKLWAAMRQLVAEGCAVVLTTHYLEEAEALAQRVVVIDKGRVLTEGSVDQLRAKVAVTRIRCCSDLDEQAVAQWSHVDEVRRNGAQLHIASREPESVVRRLLQADLALTELEVRRAGLAEAFTHLTRHDDVAEQEAA